MNYKGKKVFIMKKIIALSVAVLMLLLGFAATADFDVMDEGITVCEDIKPKSEPYDQIARG